MPDGIVKSRADKYDTPSGKRVLMVKNRRHCPVLLRRYYVRITRRLRTRNRVAEAFSYARQINQPDTCPDQAQYH